jgi:hypothetical protein
MAELWIQFDVERGYSLTRAAKMIEDRLQAEDYDVTLRRGEDYTWIGEVAGALENLSTLRGRLEQLVDTAASIGANNFLLVDDPDPAPAPSGPRRRPSPLAERIAA